MCFSEERKPPASVVVKISVQSHIIHIKTDVNGTDTLDSEQIKVGVSLYFLNVRKL